MLLCNIIWSIGICMEDLDTFVIRKFRCPHVPQFKTVGPDGFWEYGIIKISLRVLSALNEMF
ncbi:unnamed protein product [Nezara viridula]|uniref:Uncharacterized protein n=1 Tax=Nezara viridula TaxID=85310 RepID=A0A9P0HR08_NEZVI|nr:unnamed protein product [Nezara viridula]